MILKPLVLDPCLRGEFKYLNITRMQDLGSPGVGAGGQAAAPQMVPVLKQLKSILCGQCPSTAPGHPERTRLHFCSCCHIPWELDQAGLGGSCGDLERASNCVP